jgi:hypothetical protein
MAEKGWGWAVKYIIVIFVALILGVVLGNLALFRGATLGNPKLTAALLVQFISHAGALALVWILGQQAAEQLRGKGESYAPVAMIVVSLMALVLAAVGYVVLTHFIGPFIGGGLRQAIDWAFILGVVAAAVWFVMALFAGSDNLIALLREGATGRKRA